MSAKKKTPPPPQKKGTSKTVWIVAAIAAVLVIGGYAASRGGGTDSLQAAPTASAEEAEYLGRYLPEGYEAPKVSEGGDVSAETPMTQVNATAGETGLSLAVADVTAFRNVRFDYTKADGSVVPMVAYVKPSGKLYVGVSYCVPCKGTGRTLTTDGLLTCDSCGTKHDPETGIGVSGSCKLYPLDEMPATVSGDQITIEKTALESWTMQPLDRPVG